MVRMTFGRPRNTQKYSMEPISSNSHLIIKLIKRFITLSNRGKPHLIYLYKLQQNDYRSVYGRNCRNICAEAGVDNILNASYLDISYEPISPEDNYKVSLITELIEMKYGRLVCELTKKEIKCMLEILCSD